jgi:hypothetical protein
VAELIVFFESFWCVNSKRAHFFAHQFHLPPPPPPLLEKDLIYLKLKILKAPKNTITLLQAGNVLSISRHELKVNDTQRMALKTPLNCIFGSSLELSDVVFPESEDVRQRHLQIGFCAQKYGFFVKDLSCAQVWQERAAFLLPDDDG